MNDIIPHNQPNFDDMKNSISKAGGLFYQYRPCRRDVSTIYDIENIRHGVVYAQSPLNMNDPFDSMMGFSSDNIYNECISMLAQAIDVAENLKPIISVLLQYRILGRVAELISYINELKQYLVSRQKIMHQSHLPFSNFVIENIKALHSKAPKRLKDVFDGNNFTTFSFLVIQLGSAYISEKVILDMLKVDEILNELQKKAEEVRDTIYVPEVRKFLSEVTVTCFSASGWNNQLMWSHYANSYSGICVEYDFTKIDHFIGFIYPVNYTSKRSTVSMRDLGVSGFDFNSEDKIVHCEVNITDIFSYMLCKNACWSYEDEWRIINIGEENTPAFIELQYIESITFGLNLDGLCKRLLLELCSERNIKCYELTLNQDNFIVDRNSISIEEVAYDMDEEIAYITMLSEQTVKISQMMTSNSEIVVQAITAESLDVYALQNVLGATVDFLCNVYFLKTSLNRLAENSDEDLFQIEMPQNIINGINEIDASVITTSQSVEDMKKSIVSLSFLGIIKHKEYISLEKQIANIEELNEKINSHTWHSLFVKNENK